MNFLKSMSINLIRLYKNIFAVPFRVYLGGGCKFTPSCSEYAEESIRKFGVLRGTKLAVKRIIKCSPFNFGGYDPVA